MIKLAQVDIGNEYRIGPDAGVRSLGDLGSLIHSIMSNVYVLGGIVFFFFILYGGMHIIFSNDRDRTENLAKSRSLLTAAFIGFLIIVASYWIIQLISYITGFDIFSPGL